MHFHVDLILMSTQMFDYPAKEKGSALFYPQNNYLLMFHIYLILEKLKNLSNSNWI